MTTNVKLAMILAVALIASSVPAYGDALSALQAGGDRLVALQHNDGGWMWPLDDGNPATATPQNTIAPIAQGLANAYALTGDADFLSALSDTGAKLLAKTNNFSPSDGYLAKTLDDLFGGTAYSSHVVTNFYSPLAAGTYNRGGAGTLYTTASYVESIRVARAGLGNMAEWDIGMGAVAAAACGVDATAFMDGVKAELNEHSSAAYYDVIGLAGAVYAFAATGTDFDPTSGDLAAAANVSDLADILAGYQLSTGGFTWNSGYMNAGDEAIQESAYAVLALFAYDSSGYKADIASGRQYIVSTQLPTGGWESYSGSGENNELTGEAMWAVPEPATLSLLGLGGLALLRRGRK